MHRDLPGVLQLGTVILIEGQVPRGPVPPIPRSTRGEENHTTCMHACMVHASHLCIPDRVSSLYAGVSLYIYTAGCRTVALLMMLVV